MHHLIISREYPPAPYPPGGIGTYVHHISRLLAECGETVHIVAQRWPGAPLHIERHMEGRLVIHRVSLDQPLPHAPVSDAAALRVMQRSVVPQQAFSWQVARLAEHLCEHERIDVIEAQEYEAPLYHLLRRRGERSGRRQPPVIVHLHTPSEWLLKYNDVDTGTSGHRLTCMLEEYTIRTADALLCPSRFLAALAVTRYGLSKDRIDVLPYPVGDTQLVVRPPHVWEAGTICFVGRLEPRKGVQELVAAVSELAAADQGVRLSLVGGDAVHWGTGARSMRDRLVRSALPTVRDRLQFAGAVHRSRLKGHLQRARIAVVPSRFENFPNSCIEFMASGLPVVVSPSGGMLEMVEDGVTGWVARGSDAASLKTALARALSTPPAELERMGNAAADAIRRICDNDLTVQAHIQFRRRVAGGAYVAANDAADTETGLQLRHLERQIDSAAAMAADTPQDPVQTMSVLDILRAPRRQQMALLRRALQNPRYVGAWMRWHAHRVVARLAGR